MKKIYISGNYIIAEQSGLITEYAMGKSVYTKRDNTFRILEQLDKGELVIAVSDAGNWYDEAGTTAYTESTLETFFRTHTGFNIASGGNGASSASILYMELNSSQNLNVISPFTDLDFVEVTNTIAGASVDSAFPIGSETYKGVVTLPAGKYESSFKIVVQNGSNSQKIVAVNISRYAPSVIYYPQSTVYSLNRGNNSLGTIGNPTGKYQFFELTQPESFGIISARTAAGGTLDTIADQSFWQIKKIG